MRTLFTVFPAHGHLSTVLPLARAARRAGHEVVVASGADVLPEARRHGFDTWQVGPSRPETADPGRGDAAAVERDMSSLFLPSARQRAVDLVPRTVDWRPDLVVCEVSELAGPIAAAHAGARLVQHGLGFTPDGEMWEMLFRRALTGLYGDWGVPELVDAVRDAPYLDVFPPGLRGPAPAWRDVRPIRPGFGEPAPGERLPAELDALPYPRTVHLTLGTLFFDVPGVLETALAGLVELEVNVVVTTGPGTDPARLGPLPPHVFAAPYLPHALLLPRCAAVVSQGGAGVMLGALASGRPQLLLPQGADQFLNAQVCTAAGAALALTPDAFSAAAVAAAVRELLDGGAHAAAAARLQREIAAAPTPAEAFDDLVREPVPGS